jgi:hypothetical protein
MPALGIAGGAPELENAEQRDKREGDCKRAECRTAFLQSPTPPQ